MADENLVNPQEKAPEVDQENLMVQEKDVEILEKLQEEVNQEQEKSKPDFVKWDYGHLTFQCFRCGHLEILQHDVGEDLMLTLPITDKHEWRLVCPRCKNVMRLFWQQSPLTKEEVEKKEVKTTKKTKTNESRKKSKKE